MNEHLEQIARLLVDSEDVPTDASDVADEVAIVQTVKNALDYLSTARDVNRIKSEKIAKLESLNASLQDEINRINSHVSEWHNKATEYRDHCQAAQHAVDSLNGKLEAAQRKNDRYAVELGELIARSEGMRDAFGMALDKLAKVHP
jgi:chromosome segregation ATPase